MKIKLVCQECKKEFLRYPSSAYRKFCSNECYLKQHVTGRMVECFICKNSFWKKGSGIGKFNFCTKDCFNQWRYSPEVNKEIGKKIGESEFHSNRPEFLNSKCFVCNKDIYKAPCNIKKQQHLFCSRKCKGKHWSTLRREDSVNWRGGITDLQTSIRCSPENKKWIQDVFKKDDYTCQDCFYRGGSLEAHHKKRFSIIVKEFLFKYSQFSPIEDKETLIRLSLSYPDFWDVSNGKTLCVSCHRLKESVKV